MRFSIAASLSALLTLASAAEVTIQVGNPAGATNPQKFQFSPRVLRVDPTDTVTFQFNGNHSVTQQANFTLCTPGVSAGSTGQPFDSTVLPKGQSFTIPKESLVPGSIIYYYCKVGNGAHCNAPNFMQGALVVSGTPTAATGAGAAGAAVPANGATPAAGAAAQTVTVQVGLGGNVFSPSLIQAAPGDTVLFSWVGGTHNVVPSDGPQSCVKSTKLETDETLKALASGAPKSSGEHRFVVPATAQVGSKLWYYCSVGTHCSVGKMYATISIVAPGTAVNTPTAGANGTATTTTNGDGPTPTPDASSNGLRSASVSYYRR